MEQGLAASPGIAVGKAYVYRDDVEIEDGFIETQQTDFELERFNMALASAREDILLLLSDIGNIDNTVAKILKAHVQIIEDPAISSRVVEKITSNRMNAETALKHSVKYLEAVFAKMSTEYMQQRAVDIRDTGKRIMKKLLGTEDGDIILREEFVIVAEDLLPSDILRFCRSKILGFVTEYGGTISHTAILARSAGIPVVAGVVDVCKKICTGDSVIVDGNIGTVFIQPEFCIVDEYETKKLEEDNRKEVNKKIKDMPALAPNGKRIVLSANIGGVEDIDFALENGAEKIGLFRTEFIFMTINGLPDEDEQFGIYRRVIEAMKGRPVVIRTLDIGGDKNIPYLRIQKEDNPFLGIRGIRYCLRNRDIFETQLRAIIRASGDYETTILLPMVSSVNELVLAKEIIEQVKLDLKTKGYVSGDNVRVGTMIEVPSAALIVEELAEVADYFSIGTNDLCQYMLAVDRTNKELDGICDPGHPAIERIIRIIINAAHSKGKIVGICGEMAGNCKYTEMLIEAGIDEMSMSSVSIPEVKKTINSLTKGR